MDSALVRRYSSMELNTVSSSVGASVASSDNCLLNPPEKCHRRAKSVRQRGREYTSDPGEIRDIVVAAREG
jgi:hypothetical protein